MRCEIHSQVVAQKHTSLREIYIAARKSAQAVSEIRDTLATFGLSKADTPRDTLGPGIKSLARAREKISMDYSGAPLFQLC